LPQNQRESKSPSAKPAPPPALVSHLEQGVALADGLVDDIVRGPAAAPPPAAAPAAAPPAPAPAQVDPLSPDARLASDATLALRRVRQLTARVNPMDWGLPLRVDLVDAIEDALTKVRRLLDVPNLADRAQGALPRLEQRRDRAEADLERAAGDIVTGYAADEDEGVLDAARRAIAEGDLAGVAWEFGLHNGDDERDNAFGQWLRTGDKPAHLNCFEGAIYAMVTLGYAGRADVARRLGLTEHYNADDLEALIGARNARPMVDAPPSPGDVVYFGATEIHTALSLGGRQVIELTHSDGQLPDFKVSTLDEAMEDLRGGEYTREGAKWMNLRVVPNPFR
jgi:hypothetical protein